MEFVAFLVLFPFVAAALLACIKNNGARKVIVYAGSAIIIAAAIYYSVVRLMSGETAAYRFAEAELINIIMMCGEVFLMCLIIVLSIKHKKILPIILSVAQTGLMLWFELFAHHPGSKSFVPGHMLCDRLTVIMCLVVAVVGCLICVYAVGYLKDYHGHHTEYKDRRPFFCAMLFVFLGAMFGLIFSDNLIWLYFFWEITSVSSFLLIGYTKTEEAVTNSFRALWMNLLGGLGFCVAIIYAGLSFEITNLSDLISKAGNEAEGALLLLPVILLAFAALTKSAQFPFSKWLLGAMVAPTPSSALLHSATMVKAGVYLLLRLAPVMAGNEAGLMVSLIGGITFFAASVLAMTQSDGKSVLAYSTISNLGLITACAGVDTKEAVWAGALLVIFHAVSKSLLFQTVGSVEHTIGSRDIEDMTGLVRTYPVLAGALTIGISGMFLAPFGMLISKWAVLKSVLDAGNVLLVVFIVFGSATTLFYWTKWLLKILVQAPKDRQKNKTSGDQLTSIGIHAFLMIALCFVFPLISKYVLQPLVSGMFGEAVDVLSWTDMIVMVIMLVMVFVIPFLVSLFTKNAKVTESKEYMAGINVGTNDAFVDSFYNEKSVTVSNWYFGELINVDKWMTAMTWIGSAVIIILITLAAGGAL